LSKAYFLALSTLPGIGGVTARKLVATFGSVRLAFTADDEQLLAIPRITSEVVQAMRDVDIERLEYEIESMSSSGVSIVTWEDDDYPPNLVDAPDAPYLLYVAGEMRPRDIDAIAIVGTREPSIESLERAERLATSLTEAGFTIVSGLALGIDGAAHRGALLASEGRTIAVLGSGLRHIHPREHSQLAEDIARRGAVVTEYHPNTPPQGRNLMSRDRIVSGLSKAVIVIEAGLGSGSVDTARRAWKQNRAVLAVPGSSGTEDLIRSGAVALDPKGGVEAVLEAISRKPTEAEPQLNLWN